MRSKLNKFLPYLQVEKGFSRGTIEAYQLDIEKRLIPFLRQRGKFEVGDITKADIRAYLDHLAIDKGNSNATRAWKLAAIRSFFNYLVENEGLEVNPAASIRSPKIPEKEPEYLTDEGSIYLLTTIAREAKPQVRDRDLAMVVLFLHTGLRVSELTNLELVNVDLGRGQIKVTKKGNKEQYLHLNGETVNMLARYLVNRPEAQNGMFFTGNNGGNLDRRYIYGIVRRYLELASRFHIVHMEPYTRKDFIIVAERVLTMRESTASDIARLIATTVAQRSLDIRDVVKFRRAMQTQTEEEVHKMERLLGQPKMSVFKQCGKGQ